MRGAAAAGRAGIDLGAAMQVPAARRTFRLRPDGSVAVTDAVRTDVATPLRWALHTQASVTTTADGRGATLVRDGREVRVQLDPGTTGSLRVERPSLTPGGFTNQGFTVLVLDTATDTDTAATRAAGGASAQVRVTFVPVRSRSSAGSSAGS